jgi:flagellar biogenesis protein FliO
MKNDQLIDAVQTIGIITIAIVLSYVVVRIEGTLSRAADRLKKCFSTKTKSLGPQIA